MTLDPRMMANVLHQQRVEALLDPVLRDQRVMAKVLHQQHVEALLDPVLREQQAATIESRPSKLDRVRTTVANRLIALGESLQPRPASRRRASI